MYCPKCYIKFPSGERRCPKCGGPGVPRNTLLKPATVASTQAPSMAMTSKQSRYHLTKALFPFLVITVSIIGICTLVSARNFTLIALLIITGLIVAAIALNKHLYDFVNDIVHVETDQLLKIEWMYIRKDHRIYVAFFNRLGDFQIDDELYENAQLQSFYRIMYSLNTKKLWKIKLEPNQTVIDQLLNTQEAEDLKNNEPLAAQSRLSLNQRKEIIKMMLLNLGFGAVIAIFTSGSIKQLIAGSFSFSNIVQVLFLFMLWMLIIQTAFQFIDLITGKLESTVDLCIGFDRRSSPLGSRYTAKFQQLGKTFVTQQHYMHMRKGERYRIVYSRWSKLVWDVQKIT
ncbi:zinc ribbon domain-containing protein [Herpetosiphon llansteffanensis]|uniref:zinc ribbon domain-containing protein n=1 Tax=Herpetosiphon llansteffanensis TaxID=2094568 RepID=UPI000F51A6A7|nr:zinc ribbon domain-containing protein [Herpetosiphon llansteffanensis]